MQFCVACCRFRQLRIIWCIFVHSVLVCYRLGQMVQFNADCCSLLQDGAGWFRGMVQVGVVWRGMVQAGATFLKMMETAAS